MTVARQDDAVPWRGDCADGAEDAHSGTVDQEEGIAGAKDFSCAIHGLLQDAAGSVQMIKPLDFSNVKLGGQSV